MSKVVVDSSVILAVIKEEKAGVEFDQILTQSIASTVNVTEVVSKLVLYGLEEYQGCDLIGDLGVEVVDFTAEFVDLTASLIKHTKSFGLSLGDRACLSLGMMMNLPVLTCDRVWAKLDLGVQVKLLR